MRPATYQNKAIQPRFDSGGLTLQQPIAHTPREQRELAKVEQGWHHFSIPRYTMGCKPHLFCWCGKSVEMPHTNGRAHSNPELERFISEHAECGPDEAFLMSGGLSQG